MEKNNSKKNQDSKLSLYNDYLDAFSMNYFNSIDNKQDYSDLALNKELIENHDLKNIFGIDQNQSCFLKNLSLLDQRSFSKENLLDKIFDLDNKNISDCSMILREPFQKEKDNSFASNNFLSFLGKTEQQKQDSETSKLSDESQQYFRSNKFLQLRNLYYQRNFKNNFQKFFVLKILGENEKKYICLKSGLINSKKNIQKDDIYIGRVINLNNYCPNDISVIYDKTMSRIHCRLIYKTFFLQKIPLKKKQLNFLHFLKQKTIIYKKIFYMVYQYLKKPKGFYIQDLGSSSGTYLQIMQQQKLKLGHNFLLGFDAKFNVICIKDSFDQIYQIQKGAQISYENTQFIGFKHKIINKKILNREKFIILSTDNCSSNLKQFLMLKYCEKKYYNIGRKEGIDIKLNLHDISRIHCQLYCENNQWFLIDGKSGKKSKNETWINVKLDQKKNHASKKIYIQKGQKIKAGQTIFQISENFYQLIQIYIQMFYNRKLNYNQQKPNQNGVMIGNWFEESVLSELDNNQQTFVKTINSTKPNIDFTTTSMEYGKLENNEHKIEEFPRQKIMYDLYLKHHKHKLNQF